MKRYCKIILNHNSFQHSGELSIQTDGLAVGAPT